MGDVVELKLANLSDNAEFVADCCRYSENILSEEAVRKKRRFDNATWARLGNDEKLIEAINLEKTRRVRTGQQKRERAQVLITRGPDVLSEIMNAGGDVSPRYKIDAVRTLDTLAANGPGASAPAADRFQITINLGADVQLKFDKSRAVDVNDVAPFNDVNTGVIAAIAAKKPTDGGDGEPL